MQATREIRHAFLPTAIGVSTVFASLLLPLPVRATIIADHANDVCSPTANPCYVTDTVRIVTGSSLDFGTRTVHLKNGGQLDFANGQATVLCGNLIVDAWGNGARIKLHETVGGGSVGGRATIKARGSCSKSAAVACLSNDTCAAANAGACTVATGTVTLNDNVLGNANPAGRLAFEAYKAFASSQVINLSNGGSNASDVDGGELQVAVVTGSATLGGRLELDGGANAAGGSLTVSAGTDILLNESVNASGGDGGGGTISLDAGRDLRINEDVNARSDGGEGIGGEVTAQARGDVVLTGKSVTNYTVIDTKGHASGSEAGSGGTLDFDAGDAITLGAYVRLRASGPAPDGDGGTIKLWGCSVSIGSTDVLDATGDNGGQIHVIGRASIVVSSAGDVDATGGAGDDGEIVLRTRDVTPTNPSTGGSQAQFTPPPQIVEDASLAAACGG